MTDPTSDDRHQRGLETMGKVYAWGTVPDLPGDYFAVTVEHLFGDIWNREGLTIRDRRLLILGVIAALGETSVLPTQLDAALANDELTPDQLREIAIFLSHYVGWPRGAAFNNHVEARIAKHSGSGTTQKFPGAKRVDP
jgi:4-carboxymuconolactone decarboxylase